MGAKSSKRSISGRYSSYASSSSNSWGQHGYQQSNAHPAHSYSSPQPTYGGPPPPETKKRLERKYSRIDDNYNTLDQVTDALARAGLESSNLIVGIDFTKSNEWTGARSFHRRSLHHIGDEQNPYEQAISIIGRTLSKFDEDNLIPCFGFGDASTHDQEVFSFFPDDRFCDGFEEVLSRYRELVPQLRLAGPTSFAPIIEMAITIVEQSGGQYHVLLIIADGQVTRSVDTDRGQLSPQEKKTVDAIVKASEYPLSIVVVGVGDGPWDMMREFDDNIPARAFDNFQFVNFTDIMSKNVDRSRKEAEFCTFSFNGNTLLNIKRHWSSTFLVRLEGRVWIGFLSLLHYMVQLHFPHPKRPEQTVLSQVHLRLVNVNRLAARATTPEALLLITIFAPSASQNRRTWRLAVVTRHVVNVDKTFRHAQSAECTFKQG
ncbi:E3 ubiquitin-protein ligase rglg2 [Phtheirospermum japonicum]|uniref:E3 ubiquitin-protein ligase rglg2 n=1 Tax=Phtheirospermum japonicum TaxID=374723 RepID=A0A830BLD5_9LAMI|nr:E3 ubiquitin-protein ligase rglg2 [Phtheirospermum japonicum]